MAWKVVFLTDEENRLPVGHVITDGLEEECVQKATAVVRKSDLIPQEGLALGLTVIALPDDAVPFRYLTNRIISCEEMERLMAGPEDHIYIRV